MYKLILVYDTPSMIKQLLLQRDAIEKYITERGRTISRWSFNIFHIMMYIRFHNKVIHGSSRAIEDTSGVNRQF